MRNNLIPPNPKFLERIESKLKGQAFMKHIGFSLSKIELGRVEGEMELKPIHLQQFGYVHGGVVTTIADIVAGFAAYTTAPADKDVVTGEIKISCLRPGHGTKIRAVGWVLKPGRTVCFTEAEVYTIEGDSEILIAKASSSMILIPGVQYPDNE